MTTSTEGLALATRELRKSYGKRAALNGLNLSVPSGVVYGFLGPNGAGKTTTMRLLTGLLHPDAGQIEVLGRPFGRRDRKRMFEVGALVENPSFYPFLNARENLRAMGSTGAPTTNARIEELLELVGLTERSTDKVGGYSLGMKQRLGIASALLSDPKLLLLDEPANGLDPAGIVAMRETLQHLASTGKTVFVSSHLLAEVQQMADMVGIIAAGKLVKEGRMEDLLHDEDAVRVRVEPEQLAAAREIVGGLPNPGPIETSDEAPGWLTIRVEVDRAREINQALAEHGIFASRLETGSQLEELFLTLTADDAASHEGTFQGIR